MRANRPDVRNPLLRLPSAEDLAKLPAPAREALGKLAGEASRAWRAEGDRCWQRHKAPMAAYWKAMAVNARHLALLCRKVAP